MHNPVRGGSFEPLRIKGYSLDVFICTFDTVVNWGEPTLRNTFWRCYLPTTYGASIRSARREWLMTPGEAIVIPPDCAVRGHADSPFTLYYAHFNCSVRTRRPATPVVFKPVPELLRRLADAVSHRSDHLLRAAMGVLTALSIDSIPHENILTPLADERLDNAYRLMKERIDERIPNSVLAGALHMSEASLLRLFRASIGSSPQKEHMRLRLNHAAELLRSTDESIEHIAEATGFWDRNHLTRAFTSEYHNPPALYRSQSTQL
jgi:AraC-like DNA-binding protein